jgi:protein-disulfide isomerase
MTPSTFEVPRPAAPDARDGARHASPASRPGTSPLAAVLASAPGIGHHLGAADAAATLIVYGTYECLHCRRAWPALRALATASDALVAVTWRHFAPPGAFPNAAATAAGVEAAAEQGRFWAMHEALMAAPAPIWPEAVTGHAAALGLDAARFAAAMRSDAVRDRLAAQAEAAVAHGVRGTPTVLLARDGVEPLRLDARDPDALADAVRAALAA